jgi:hypothetical protein
MSEEINPTTGEVKPVLSVAAPKALSSASIGKLALALAKAQGAMENAKKDASNPFFQSKYADLASVVDAIRKPLSDNELAYVQRVETTQNGAAVITTILHSSGEWMECGRVWLPLGDKATAQAFGSVITYARRYSLSAAFGIGAEDDDGNAASGKGTQLQQPNAPRAGVYRTTTGKPDPRLSPEDNVKAAELFAPGRK